MWKGDRRALSAKTHMALGVAFTCQENKSIDTLDSSNCLLWLPSQSVSPKHGCVCMGGGGVYIKIRILGKNIHIHREGKLSLVWQLQEPALSVK